MDDQVSPAGDYISSQDSDDVISSEKEDLQPNYVSPTKVGLQHLSFDRTPHETGDDLDDSDLGEEDIENTDDEDNLDEDDEEILSKSTDDPLPQQVVKSVDADSSGDELLVNRKTLKTTIGSISPKKRQQAKKIGSTANKRSTSKTQKDSKVKKRKVQEILTPDAQDDEEVMAAVVMDDTIDSECESIDAEVLAVAEVVANGGRGESGRKKRIKKSSHTSFSENAVVKIRRKPGPRPGWKKRKQDKGSDMSSDESTQGQREIPAQKRDAAERSRDILLHSVEHLPFAASESVIVRNFGRLKMENDRHPYDLLYSSPNALYPVGYSCDRYEFSPIHGRVMKFRCEILNGSKYAELLFDDDAATLKEDSYDGPIFRILWGKGVDEWDHDRSVPFDMNSMSSTLITDGVESLHNATQLQPEPGMRAKVRFDEDTWYKGTIGNVQSHDVAIDDKSKKRGSKGESTKQIFTVQIFYSDGSNEQLDLPDPDVILLPQGSEEEESPLSKDSLQGKPVFSVVGKTATEAWGRALIKLGLLDEVTFDASLGAISDAHSDGLLEADERLATLCKQRREARARHYQKLKDRANGKISTDSSINLASTPKNEDEAPMDEIKGPDEGSSDDFGVKELSSEKEENLTMMLGNITMEYDSMIAQSRELATDLGQVRVSTLGPFLLYPFTEEETIKSVLNAVIKKEKSRMGSTGSRRKVIVATDLLEKSTSFFNYGIERLIEGLPGSESASSYVYHELRGPNASGVNQLWVYEILSKLKKQKQAIIDSEDADIMEGGVEISERQLKSKKLDVREMRKKQKLEELEREKQVRREDRLSRLSNQIEERLMKEASLAREKIIGICAKATIKEYNRRRKAAEILTTHKIESSAMDLTCQRIKMTELPPLSKDYDLDVVRIWNFIITYKGAFKNVQDHLKDLSLDSLQDSLDCMRSHPNVDTERNRAVAILSNLAIALCKPISIGLLKTLSSTLASFQSEKYGFDGTNEFYKADCDPFPVNLHTWKEIARLALLSEALSEVGYGKQDQAHILRGFRSGGHPHSKQAKKLRRGEDYALVLQQQLLHRNVALEGNIANLVKVKIPIPSKPSSGPNTWSFFLHNVLSLPINSVSGVKINIRKALSILKTAPSDNFTGSSSDEIVKKLQDAAALLDPIGVSVTDPTQIQEICRTVRDRVLNILKSSAGALANTKDANTMPESINVTNTSSKPKARSRIGFLRTLTLSREMHKRYSHQKEDYMGSALKLKADLERKLDEDDSDDEEEETETEISTEFRKNEILEVSDVKKIGRATDYDDFCGDNPNAPELLRRCLAVLRTLCISSPAEPFIFPVDPQTNPKYYDTILRPMSLYDVGKILQNSIKVSCNIERTVSEFGRNVRLIYQNCMCYSNIGGSIISAAEEMIRVFERLFFDWVLAPENELPPLDMLDDDHCVELHASDDDCNVLICDGCEGKFNMSRLNPPLHSVPSGDWYCPRCLCGRSWSTVDPRINLQISNGPVSSYGTISRCIVSRGDGETDETTLSYIISYKNNQEEIWALEKVDKALIDAGLSVSPVRCLEAVAESPGYGMGTDNGLILDILPAPLNPFVSDIAAQKTLSSSFFNDTIVMCATLLLLEVQELSASEWIRLLILLVIKCTSSESFQDELSNLENEGASKFIAESSSIKISSVYDVLPPVSDNDVDVHSIVSSENLDENVDSPLPINRLESIIEGEPLLLTSKTVHTIETRNDYHMGGAHAEVVETERAIEPPIVPGIKLEEINDQDKELKGDMMLTAALSRNDRQKAREDNFLAQSVKMQLTSTIASFEEDNVTQVIDTMLANKADGIKFSDCRCPCAVCDFCGLSDIALGTPLVRVPNDQEWLDIMSYAAASRNIFLTAEVGKSPNSSVTNQSKLILVKIRLGNNFVSGKLENKDGFDNNNTTEFLPRCSAGFQHELKCRLQDGFPFVSGSLSAHDCCAAAAHKARCDKIMLEGKERAMEDLERDFGSSCGRSLPLGCDELGRSYWKFAVDQDSLFVLMSAGFSSSESVRRYSTPESIASVIVSLGGAYPSTALTKAFPDARRVLRGRLWTTLLQKHSFVMTDKGSNQDNSETLQLEDTKNGVLHEIPFTVGENVLVEDASGKLLWDATVVNTNQTKEGRIDAYCVHYKDWSTRFDNWVKPTRVVEPSKHNQLVQEMINEKAFVPNTMNLIAQSFIREPRRARGNIPAPIYFELFRNKAASVEQRTLDLMKFGILLVEAALPQGSLNTSSDEGLCSPEMTAGWRSMVLKAQGPRALAGCLILLENSIRKQWFRSDTEQLLLCMHRPFKAVNEATISSIALRLWLLDRGIKYTQIED